MAAHDDDRPLSDDELALARRGAALIAEAMAHPEARAPHALRESLSEPAPAPRRARSHVGPWRPLVAGLGLAAAVVVAVVLVALGGSHGGPAAPSVAQVRAVARRAATVPAPARVTASGGRAFLAAAVQGQAFPDWSRAFGWIPSGSRHDRLGGRAITTVFYRYRDGTRLGYAIVAGPPLDRTTGHDIVVAGTRYRAHTGAGRTTLTWTQTGHTCLIDAPATVPTAALVTLATWAYR